jgi:A/G-specific adenine glycosylase
LATGATVKPQTRGDAERKISAPLIRWFREKGRDLAWRRTLDPYAVLVSEFMLQQTTVAAVTPYFERWMKAFPDVAALAAADEQAVLGHWQGLGYYSRARNLHRAAKAMVEHHGGKVPGDLAALEALPGIGAYTAAAVTAFAFDRPAAVVDANVARVLARLRDFRDPIDTARGKAFLREAAWALQPERGAGEFNSALMELGALVCKPARPLCPMCPIRGSCRTPEPGPLPVKRARQAVTQVTERRAWIVENGAVHLALSAARWKGMWILPEIDDPAARIVHVESYPITRYRVRMEVVIAEPAAIAGLRSFPIHELDAVPIPSPHRRAIRALAKATGSGHRGA